MQKKKLLASALSLAMVVTMLPAGATNVVQAADTPKEKILAKSASNPLINIPGDTEGTYRYGGDPSVLVDGDTVYLYVGHDTSSKESYFIPEWDCYSSTDLKSWKFESTIMKADKESVTWANTGTDAWAGQVAKYKDKYYFYYCTWDATSNGEQSIGVAVSDKPAGPFKDIGAPLVKGTTTNNKKGNWCNYNDIDPTFWIETDSEGVEHRYLCWGNNKLFVCELNEDMTSVKDINGDGQITFGVQTADQLKVDADIVEKLAPASFTEAPWLYRRQKEDGSYYGSYYLFYAYGWREQMAYATISESDGLMSGKWTYGTDGKNGLLMVPTATSNTNHMAVFDFKGKTYFVYHNGMLPGGSGFRRSPNIAEVHFNEDGSIEKIPETTKGLFGTTSAIYNSSSMLLAHKSFINSSTDGDYPYLTVPVTGSDKVKTTDVHAQWVMVSGTADTSKESYVSIASEDKPGLYLTVNDNNSVTLGQNAKLSDVANGCKKQTFKTVEGLNDPNGVSFESVAKPGFYITSLGSNALSLTSGALKSACTFYIDKLPETIPTSENAGTANSLDALTVKDYETTKNNDTYTVTVPYETTSISVSATLSDPKGFLTLDGVILSSGDSANVTLTGNKTTSTIEIFAENATSVEKYTLEITKKLPDFSGIDLSSNLVYSYGFEDTADKAAAVKTSDPKGQAPVSAGDVNFTYKDGKLGKAIYLDGTYGLDLGDANPLTDDYTISYWVNPDELHSAVDPTFAAGTFNPENWLNVTADSSRAIWSGKPYAEIPGDFKYVAGQWQHVVISVSGDKATFYYNGEKAGSGDIIKGIMTAANSRLYFGVNGWDLMFKGSVDDLMLFNKAVSDTEALAIANEAITTANTTAKAAPGNKENNDTPAAKKASTVTLANKSAVYNGKAQTIGAAVKTGSTAVVTYSYFSDKACTKSVAAANVKNVGTYYVKASVAADANFNAAVSNVATLTITKADNSLTVSVKSKKFSVKKNLKKAKSFKLGAKSAQGTLTFTLDKKAKKAKLKVSKAGKVTVPKKCKKGTYKITVKAAGNAYYNAKSITVKVKVVK